MHCRATARIYGLTPDSRELLFMSFSFDGAHERWLTALTTGAQLAVRGPDLWTPEQALDCLLYTSNKATPRASSQSAVRSRAYRRGCWTGN